MPRKAILLACLALLRGSVGAAVEDDRADLVLHHGKIVTVDAAFRLSEAVAVRGDRILAVGGNDEILKLARPDTRQIDLKGKTVLPGLIDSHSHTLGAAIFEFDHPVPEMRTIADVLAYVRSRAAALQRGQWIRVQQVFITRLREQRFPTRQELDEAAPDNPVVFRTGPDASLNSLALKLSHIDKEFRIPEGQAGQVERDPQTGEPTGILRNCARYIAYQSPEKTPNAEERRECLKKLLAAYNAVGITGVVDRDTYEDAIDVYQQLKDRGDLSCRAFLSYHLDGQGPWEQIEAGIRRAAGHPLHRYNNMLWLRGVKIYLDGGMLTGSAYMRQPWGVSKIYSITDPQYRGVLFVQPERLYQIARLALENDLQITAHTVGDGAVHALIAAYERVDRDSPVRDKRPCISHCNFMSMEAIEKMRRLGIVADMQPAWIYLDGATLRKHFGEERLTYFQPYKTLFEHGVTVGGGSDHMQKVDSLRSLNPYNPFLGMWITLARLPRGTDKPLHPEQAILREQAIRLYTNNCAYLTFEEKEKGSLEKGKLADFIVLDRDILTCPVDEVKDITVEETWLGGKRVYAKRAVDTGARPPRSSAVAEPPATSAGWPISADKEAKRVYAEDYENGKCERIKPNSSAAVVGPDDGAEPHSGKYCLRGNYDPKTTDPITKKKGATRYAGLADISLSKAGVKDRMYVSYWWRLDPTNKFVAEPPSNFGGQKHAFITGSAEPWAKKVDYVVGQGWGPDHWWIVNNNPDPTSPSYQANARVAAKHAKLGIWHHVEFYLRMDSAPLKSDGLALLKLDGELYIDKRDVPLTNSVPQTWNAMALPSMFGGPTSPLESFGWQLDDLEIWDGLPAPGKTAESRK